jgi:hypothetical protein
MLMKWQVDEMASWRNDMLMKWRIYLMTSLIKSEVDETAN